ncbi:ribosome maturation factor RimM [Leptodesmis sichuanensis A121]|nr:ribosome maturation factor RimM [Leptodesmis sichuanensis A121]
MMAGFIEIGRIVGAQGLTGEVRVYPSSDFPERFLEPGNRWLLPPGATDPKLIELVQGRYLESKGLYIVQIAGITDRNQAEALRNSVVLVSEQDRPLLEEDEFYILDLIGLEVFDQASQTLIGTVINVLSAGNDLLEVQRNLDQTSDRVSTKTVLIPFVKAIVPVVDLSQHRIEITPPAGLIE